MAAPEARRIQVDLSGRVAIVTGASRGIGQQIAFGFGRAGAKVACVARNVERLAETVEKIRDAGGEAEVYTCDVAAAAGVAQVVDSVVENWGRLDILVNNAGIHRDTLIPRMTDEDFDQVVATNLRSVFLFTRAASRCMVRGKYGRIINMSSVSGGVMGNAGQANYSASKAGIVGMTRTVARELISRRRNITVNAICPGFIASDMTDAMGEGVEEMVKQRVPAQRLGQAEEIADAVLFLASDSASYITGAVLTVDGGLTA